MIMDDPPCTQLLLTFILHRVVVDDSCDFELLHLLQLEEFSRKFGWSVVDSTLILSLDIQGHLLRFGTWTP